MTMLCYSNNLQLLRIKNHQLIKRLCVCFRTIFETATFQWLLSKVRHLLLTCLPLVTFSFRFFSTIATSSYLVVLFRLQMPYL